MNTAAPSLILSFAFGNIPVRGKLVRLANVGAQCPSLQIAAGEADIAPVTTTLLEMLVGAVLMVQDFKTGADVTLQMHAAAHNATWVTRCDSSNHIRAWANTEAHGVPFANLQHTASTFAATVTLNEHTYQSLLPLEADTAAQAIAHYFTHSVQAATHLRVWVCQHAGQVHCGALFLQALPNQGESYSDDWQRLSYILDTVTSAEAALADSSVGGTLPTQLLGRLFAEDEVNIYPLEPIVFAVESPRARMGIALQKLGQTTCAEMLQEGPIVMQDAYTGQEETFTAADIAALFVDNPA
ncbi:MAG: Hsp33 family molecular chaperone HslO [Alphaproteobacteria bacterium]